jgi:hypothetical protein
MNQAKFRLEQKLRLLRFTLTYLLMYGVIGIAIWFHVAEGDTMDPKALNCFFVAAIGAFAYLLIRVIKRYRHRCPACREGGILHGWLYKREYERVPPRGKYPPNALQCNYDLRCLVCRRGYQKKMPDVKIFNDRPSELISV